MRTIIALVVSIAILGGAPVPATAGLWDEIKKVGKKIDDEVFQPAKEAIEEAGRDIDDEIFQPAKEAIEEAGRDIDDEIFQPIKASLTRCYDRAEQEPDTETKQARWKACEERKTGAILGTVGLAVGSVLVQEVRRSAAYPARFWGRRSTEHRKSLSQYTVISHLRNPWTGAAPLAARRL